MVGGGIAEGRSGLTGSGTHLGASVVFGFASSFFLPRFKSLRRPADIPVFGSVSVLCGVLFSSSPAADCAVKGAFSEDPSPSIGPSDVLEPGSLPMALCLPVCAVAMFCDASRSLKERVRSSM